MQPTLILAILAGITPTFCAPATTFHNEATIAQAAYPHAIAPAYGYPGSPPPIKYPVAAPVVQKPAPKKHEKDSLNIFIGDGLRGFGGFGRRGFGKLGYGIGGGLGLGDDLLDASVASYPNIVSGNNEATIATPFRGGYLYSPSNLGYGAAAPIPARYGYGGGFQGGYGGGYNGFGYGQQKTYGGGNQQDNANILIEGGYGGFGDRGIGNFEGRGTEGLGGEGLGGAHSGVGGPV
ncbi:hypothetical protein HDU76_011022 [Blyttiomyces sp. JEL0837]|nr:hypothetical protein HDU76_011022 [Blyttiomyces sp. JEL0837]